MSFHLRSGLGPLPVPAAVSTSTHHSPPFPDQRISRAQVRTRLSADSTARVSLFPSTPHALPPLPASDELPVAPHPVRAPRLYRPAVPQRHLAEGARRPHSCPPRRARVPPHRTPPRRRTAIDAAYCPTYICPSHSDSAPPAARRSTPRAQVPHSSGAAPTPPRAIAASTISPTRAARPSRSRGGHGQRPSPPRTQAPPCPTGIALSAPRTRLSTYRQNHADAAAHVLRLPTRRACRPPHSQRVSPATLAARVARRARRSPKQRWPVPRPPRPRTPTSTEGQDAARAQAPPARTLRCAGPTQAQVATRAFWTAAARPLPPARGWRQPAPRPQRARRAGTRRAQAHAGGPDARTRLAAIANQLRPAPARIAALLISARGAAIHSSAGSRFEAVAAAAPRAVARGCTHRTARTVSARAHAQVPVDLGRAPCSEMQDLGFGEQSTDGRREDVPVRVRGGWGRR
ncbi:hypothetical protein B0H15DRAFT_1023605 [Mycena belliarum]|uniref:Uncharacterized protein n=1 Tax=Mycena belliarum TaxID=1033014 RepID=A0AAD6XQC8_9AGAR|nr:hypothetical protein B0H15DRAFT_1023605 [Mycena belliae]